MRKEKYSFKSTWQFLQQLLFPLRCPICDEIAPWGKKICPRCAKKPKWIRDCWCMRCGVKLTDEAEYCAVCKQRERAFDRGRSLFEYASVAQAIYRFKYGGRKEYADYFGARMAQDLAPFIKKTDADFLVPIPLHPARLRKRGYNQARLLAKELEKRLSIPVREDLLARCKKTVPMKQLNWLERQNNLKKAFLVAGNDVESKVVILVDDIYTTGATMEEAARMLKAAGAKAVYFVALSAG
jgi:ComF family protein